MPLREWRRGREAAKTKMPLAMKHSDSQEIVMGDSESDIRRHTQHSLPKSFVSHRSITQTT
jgi:hypothetical protein